MLDSINLTPELCSKFLKFVAPILGDSTQIDGKFSAQMNAATLPLFAPSDGSAQGELLIERVQARPGRLALQIVQAIDQVQSIIKRSVLGGTNLETALIEMPEQQIPFKLEQRRVYHQGMTFLVNNVSVKTTGSVGMDTTLSLVAEISIHNDWLGNNKVLAGLKGKSIQIPITGTTSRPQIDPSVFSNLLRQLGGSAVEDLLQEKVGGRLNEAVNDGLDKLLKGQKVMSLSGLIGEFRDLWRTGNSMDDVLSRFVTETKSRAAGCWRLQLGQLKLVGFGWAGDMPEEVSQGFQAATRCVSLDQTGLGIVRAVVTDAPVIACRDPRATGLDGSASWIVRFGANTSLAVPIRDAVTHALIGALAVSTAAFIEEGDLLWGTVHELASDLGKADG